MAHDIDDKRFKPELRFEDGRPVADYSREEGEEDDAEDEDEPDNGA